MERSPGTLYRESKDRVVDIVRSLDDDALSRTVAATPTWTARDVLAHLAGACEDVATGNIAGADSEDWTAAQVARGRTRSVDAVVDAWNQFADAAVAALDGRQLPLFWLWDVLSHEGDLRETHGLGPLDQSVVDEALTPLWSMFAKRYPGPGRIEADIGTRTLTMGSGDPLLRLRTSPYELFRGMVSRRSRAQMMAWDWDGDGDPAGVLGQITVFGVRDHDQPVPP